MLGVLASKPVALVSWAVAMVLSHAILAGIVVVAYLSLLFDYIYGAQAVADIACDCGRRGQKRRSSGEEKLLVSSEVAEFANALGLAHERHHVTTADGFVLVLDRVYEPAAKSAAADTFAPVVCHHGVLQRSGLFLAGQRRSLAYYLARRGFDVWLSNSRGVYPLHEKLNASDDKFWDWSVDELGKYDFPAIVSYVRNTTGRKITYVGHSQGAGQSFIGLHTNPAIADDLALLVGLSPAVFVHPPPRFMVGRLLVPLGVRMIRAIFGVGSFLPLMSPVQRWMPPVAFGHLGYIMFSYLFGWDDHLWAKGRHATYFQVQLPSSHMDLAYLAHAVHAGPCVDQARVAVDDEPALRTPSQSRRLRHWRRRR
eukprot:TRINITY_DN9557_c0_g1_i2.p1 TRINITY_DN9557_c0_g1~~TRINITY_DN9557_c0_g1_i2.p1  ORF type:complete len:394 (+),score=66.68 TRINITY_DN9557_c0_g1_i2:80-1183(+)